MSPTLGNTQRLISALPTPVPHDHRRHHPGHTATTGQDQPGRAVTGYVAPGLSRYRFAPGSPGWFHAVRRDYGQPGRSIEYI